MAAPPEDRAARMVWEPLRDRMTWTPALYRLYGMDPATGAARFETFLEHAHPDERDTLAMLVSERLRTLEPFSVRHRIVREDGKVLLVELRGKILVDERGNLQRLEIETSLAD